MQFPISNTSRHTTTSRIAICFSAVFICLSPLVLKAATPAGLSTDEVVELLGNTYYENRYQILKTLEPKIKYGLTTAELGKIIKEGPVPENPVRTFSTAGDLREAKIRLLKDHLHDKGLGPDEVIELLGNTYYENRYQILKTLEPKIKYGLTTTELGKIIKEGPVPENPVRTFSTAGGLREAKIRLLKDHLGKTSQSNENNNVEQVSSSQRDKNISTDSPNQSATEPEYANGNGNTSGENKPPASAQRDKSYQSDQYQELKGKLERIERITLLEPEYSYDTSNFDGAVAAIWMNATDLFRGTKDLRDKYNAYYENSLRYRSEAHIQKIYARRAFDRGDSSATQHHIDEFHRMAKIFSYSEKARHELYLGNLESAHTYAEGIYKRSKFYVSFGTRFTKSYAPWTSYLFDGIFRLTDFHIYNSELGLSEALKKSASEALVSYAIDHVKLDEYGGKTISDLIDERGQSLLSPPEINTIFKDENVKNTMLRMVETKEGVAKLFGSEMASKLTKDVGSGITSAGLKLTIERIFEHSE